MTRYRTLLAYSAAGPLVSTGHGKSTFNRVSSGAALAASERWLSFVNFSSGGSLMILENGSHRRQPHSYIRRRASLK